MERSHCRRRRGRRTQLGALMPDEDSRVHRHAAAGFATRAPKSCPHTKGSSLVHASEHLPVTAPDEQCRPNDQLHLSFEVVPSPAACEGRQPQSEGPESKDVVEQVDQPGLRINCWRGRPLVC